MGKQYFCEYCNRSFTDVLDARKKHLNGSLHIRNRKLHYSLYKDLKTTVSEELTKEECRRFRMFKECQFGENCNFTHYSKKELEHMKQQVEAEEDLKKSHPQILNATVEQWLETKLVQKNIDLPNPFVLLPHLFPHLPPSLQLPPEDNLWEIEFAKWVEE